MSLSCTVSKILGLSVISQNLKRSRYHAHALVLLCVDLYTKFEMPSFTHSKDMTWAKNKMGRITRPGPFWGWYVICCLQTAMTNYPTKTEVTIFICYERWNDTIYYDRKCYSKCGKWRSLGSSEVTGNSAIRYSAYDFLMAFCSKYIPILHLIKLFSYYYYRFWDIARCYSKIADLPYLCLVLLLGWPHWNFAEIFSVRKLESLWYHRAFWHDPRLNRIGRTPNSWQSDWQTHGGSIYRAVKIWTHNIISHKP